MTEDEVEQIKRLLGLANVTDIPDPLELPMSTITKLNLPGCGLSSLPECLPEALPNLSILFLSSNQFRIMPEVIGKCPKLQMVAFKANGMEKIHPEALQPQLRWLILTDNRLKELPDTIGRCKKLQKCMLSGNQLTVLPDSISNCTNLELIRLASNVMTEPPLVLLQLPKLAWVALSDNPFLAAVAPQANTELAVLDIPDDVGEVLGQGAGGITRKVEHQGSYVAVKTHGGAMTSDGSPEQERRIACAAAALESECLIQLLGETKSGALVMEYLHEFSPIAGPPSFQSCSRDVYASEFSLTLPQANKIVTGLLKALHKLHAVGICHGDFYGHNILISRSDKTNVRLSDFGAAFFYDKNDDYGSYVETIELRSFSIFVDEMADLVGTNGEVDGLRQRAIKCREGGATFESVMVRWTQQHLAALTKQLDAELDIGTA